MQQLRKQFLSASEYDMWIYSPKQREHKKPVILLKFDQRIGTMQFFARRMRNRKIFHIFSDKCATIIDTQQLQNWCKKIKTNELLI